MKKSLFSINVSLHRVLSTVRPSGIINTVPPERGKLVTLIVGVGVQHSNEVHLTILLWSFVAVRCYAIDIRAYYSEILVGTYSCPSQGCSFK